ncbi:hypothetical protein B0T09DRAFT_94037 [Sordaria sp. MPI-SDFR-AT-0083]|nr:hypothetical protein B0T09DRAFT_94037 [Sordaria sp. MPI-SDFR-AT-0083]
MRTLLNPCQCHGDGWLPRAFLVRISLEIFACHPERRGFKRYVLETDRARGQWRTRGKGPSGFNLPSPNPLFLFLCRNSLLLVSPSSPSTPALPAYSVALPVTTAASRIHLHASPGLRLDDGTLGSHTWRTRAWAGILRIVRLAIFLPLFFSAGVSMLLPFTWIMGFPRASG